MTRSVNLLEYLPQFIREYKEIQCIMNTENPELQLVFDLSENIKNNQFISSCNEQGISRFEKMLDIEPVSTDTLETRIGRVLVKWMDTIPYTINSLKQKLDVLLGEGKHSETVDYGNFYLFLTADIDTSEYFKPAMELLEEIVPVNMTFDSRFDGCYDMEIDTDMIYYQSSNLPVCGVAICGGRKF